jgi:hypothetical protein
MAHTFAVRDVSETDPKRKTVGNHLQPRRCGGDLPHQGDEGNRKGKKPGGIEAGIAAGYGLWISKKNAKLQGLTLPEKSPHQPDKLWDEQGKELKK